MSQAKKARSYEWVGKALGADPPIRIKGPASKGPLDLLHLAHDLRARLQSSGGRPTDPTWKMYRQVPFAPERWRALERLAEAFSSEERQVSPAQVAAALVEYGLEEVTPEEFE